MKHRTFIALDLPENITEQIVDIQNKIKDQNLFYGKLTANKNLHLTLKFLGEIDENKLELVKQELNKIKMKSFDVHLGAVGVFNPKFIRIIWIKMIGDYLNKLQKEIDIALEDIFRREKRFMSHITIARPKRIEDKTKLIEFLETIKIEKTNFKINKFVLKKSELTPQGPIYSILESYDLD